MDSRDDMSNQSDDPNGDGEGVWSRDIEQSFREALILFPPCGRRKHILQEEGGGKMYGRNELIARHIQMRTGKRRTRKQVSSHIQVLARRQAKLEAGANSGSSAGVSPSPSNVGLPISNNSANGGANNILADGSLAREQMSTNLSPTNININSNTQLLNQQQQPLPIGNNNRLNEQINQQALIQQQQNSYDIWMDRPIVTQKIRLVEFSAFVEYNPASHQFSQHQTAASAAGLHHHMVPDQLNILQQQQPVSPTINHMSHLQQHALAQNGHHHDQQNYQQPLASNHHLPNQFNQANPYPNNNSNNTNINNNSNNNIHDQRQMQMQQQPQHTQQPLAPAGSIRHSYIKINYSQPHTRQLTKLERIDITQIQDKFPEISEPNGLYQRGPSDAFFLVKFWADLNNDYEYNINDQNSFFGFSSHFETINPYRDITCSTKACSYGLQVIEKVEKIYGCFNNLNGRYSYDMSRSPMCEFMIHFIRKLRQLPQASQMNSVLENFTVLQVITSESTSEILLCLAYVFEVAMEDHIAGPQYNVYKLTKD